MKAFLLIFKQCDIELLKIFFWGIEKTPNWNMRLRLRPRISFRFFLSFTKGTIVKYQENKKVGLLFNNNRNKLCSHSREGSWEITAALRSHVLPSLFLLFYSKPLKSLEGFKVKSYREIRLENLFIFQKTLSTLVVE